MNQIKPITKIEAEKALDLACDLLEKIVPEFTEKFQASASDNNFYKQTENVEWTTGFLTGEYWLAYERTNNVIFKNAALTQVESFMNRIVEKIDVNHHDMGFLYTPSCVAAYKLTQSETAKKAGILAADNLIARFHRVGNFIQAWGELGAENNYRLIIDCLLNMPLLHWASEVTGDEKYSNIAKIHTKTSLANLIREDNSTYHTHFFDKKTGEATYGATHQGYRDGSAWARGQAWGVYGVALSYLYTRDESCFELFDKVTEFYIQHSPKDLVAFWDMDFTDGSEEPRDSSAAAIAACGMLEMAKYFPEEKANYYCDVARKIAKSLTKIYAVKNSKESNGLLLHGVYAKASPYNPISPGMGVDECNSWGDYFYIELLTRLTTEWKLYW